MSATLVLLLEEIKKSMKFEWYPVISVYCSKVRHPVDRAVAQAISRSLPTAATRVRVWAACGVCGGQSGTGAGFLRVLRFPLPIIPPISPSSLSPEAGTIDLLVAAVPSEATWIPPTTPHYTN
jgi:hypothetical protein